MDKLGDMDLFVRVVKNSGLAAAGREVGLSPARMTARITGLEQRYGVRLLNRTTRQVTLTEEGAEFYHACLRVLAEVDEAESRLQTGRAELSGPLRVTAPSDLGQQHITTVIDQFVANHPDVQPYLHLTDGIVNLSEEGFDVGIRYGALADSSMIAKKLVDNHRVICASPDYLNRRGAPQSPEDLAEHDCLAMVRVSEPLLTWYFRKGEQRHAVQIKPVRSSNDGAMIRRWANEGQGVALKSYIDIALDIKEKRLSVLMTDYTQDYGREGVDAGADVNVVYPNRQFLPERVRAFIVALTDYFDA